MKLLSHLTHLSISAAILVGCATESADQAHQEEKKDELKAEEFQPTLVDDRDSKIAELNDENQELPANVVIRVDLDEEGNEVPDSAKMVTIDSAVSGPTIESDFEAGAVVENNANADDLESDSSSDMWYGYRGVSTVRYRSVRTVNYGHGGAAYGHHAAYGVARGGAYGVSYRSSRYYTGYRPYRRSTVYRGSFWRYGRPFCYSYGRRRYYRYPRPVLY